MKREKISSQEQLERWVAGESVHREADHLKDGECCPDFSCCQPDNLASAEIRRAFLVGDEKTRLGFLGVFLGEMLSKHASEKKVKLVGFTDPEDQS